MIVSISSFFYWRLNIFKTDNDDINVFFLKHMDLPLIESNSILLNGRYNSYETLHFQWAYTRHDFQSDSRLRRSSVAVYRTSPRPFRPPFLKIGPRREITPRVARYSIPMTRPAHTRNFRYVIEYQTVRRDEKRFLHGIGALCNLTSLT